MCLQCQIWEVETPGGFLDICPAYQLQRWIEYFNHEPFGSEIEDQRQDVRTSFVFSELVNNVRVIMTGLGGKRNIEMLKPDHFRISDKSKQIETKNIKKITKPKSQTQIFKDEMKNLKKITGNVIEDPSTWQPVMID